MAQDKCNTHLRQLIKRHPKAYHAAHPTPARVVTSPVKTQLNSTNTSKLNRYWQLSSKTTPSHAANPLARQCNDRSPRQPYSSTRLSQLLRPFLRLRR